MTKRGKRSPREIIESSKNPEFERMYLKFPREELIDVTKQASYHYVIPDTEKEKKLFEERGWEDYTRIHTHPWSPGGASGFFPFLPTLKDIEGFLLDKRQKMMGIILRNIETGEVRGSFFLRKTKKTKIREFERPRLDVYEGDLDYLARIVKEYNLQYKYIPGKKGPYAYFKSLFENYLEHTDGSLESKVLGVTTILGLVFSIFFLQSNFTGYAISNLNQTSSNWIGLVCLGVGLIAGYFYFKKR